MASKRCFSRQLIDSDDFFCLSHGAQLLYFYVALSTDDDGMVSGFRRIMSQCGQSDKELEELVKAGFIIQFEKCLVVCHHWINNNFQADRYHNTIFLEEYNQLEKVNRVYRLKVEQNEMNLGELNINESNLTNDKKTNQTKLNAFVPNLDTDRDHTGTNTDTPWNQVDDSYDSLDEKPFV